jgi:hypothetical protein
VRGPPARSSDVRCQGPHLVVVPVLVWRAVHPRGISRGVEDMRAGGPRTQAWASLVLALCRFLCLVRIDRVRLIVGILSALPRTVREPPRGSIVGDTTAELHLRRDH